LAINNKSGSNPCQNFICSLKYANWPSFTILGVAIASFLPAFFTNAAIFSYSVLLAALCENFSPPKNQPFGACG
jgi:hypothetical protein